MLCIFMYRFLAAGSLNKSDQETHIDGPEPSWQLAQQGPSVPSKESGIREKRIWDALEIFRTFIVQSGDIAR